MPVDALFFFIVAKKKGNSMVWGHGRGILTTACFSWGGATDCCTLDHGKMQVIRGLHQADGKSLCEEPAQLWCDKLNAVPTKAIGCLHSGLAELPTSMSLRSRQDKPLEMETHIRNPTV